MTPDSVLSIFQHVLQVILLLLVVILVPALIVGLLVSMFQAATQINEMTLSFIPKLGVLVVALFVFGPWMLSNIVNFARELITNIPLLMG